MVEKNQTQNMQKQLQFWKISTWVTVFLLLGLIIWSLATGLTPAKLQQLSQNPSDIGLIFSRLKTDKDFATIQAQIQSYIDKQYVGKAPTSEEYRTALLKGYVNALGDKYSQYLTKADYTEITQSLNSSFSGIGISFEYFGSYIEVQQVFDNTPAKENGLKAGDRIISVDDISVSTFGSSEVVRSKITGPANTTVKLAVISDGATKDISVERRQISFPIVTYAKTGTTGVIRVSTFGEKVDEEMNKIATQIRADPEVKNIVLDLTNNTGGYLNGAVDLVSYFAEIDKVVVIDKSKDKEETLKTVEKKQSLKDYPLVVTTNRFTASASEITTGALQDLRQVKVVGSKTFGKGVVQQIFPLGSGDALKLTIAEWLTPNRRAINGVGINPDFYVEKDEVKAVLERFSWGENSLK
jgi:carboxyl-terminal processing protease